MKIRGRFKIKVWFKVRFRFRVGVRVRVGMESWVMVWFYLSIQNVYFYHKNNGP